MYRSLMRKWWLSLGRDENEKPEPEKKAAPARVPVRPREDYRAVPMGEALTPAQCEVMRAFLRDLLRAQEYAKVCKVQRYDVLAFAREWRETRWRLHGSSTVFTHPDTYRC